MKNGKPQIRVEPLFGKEPPHAVECERGLLASALIDPHVIGDVVMQVSADDFYTPTHGEIFQTLVDLYDGKPSFDWNQVIQSLRDRGSLERIGGAEYLAELMEGVFDASNADEYARVVVDKAQIRRLIQAAGSILHHAYQTTDSAAQQVDEAENAIFQLREARSTSEPQPLAELVQEAYRRLEQKDGVGMGLPVPFHELHDILGGLQPSELIIVAARPSMGKTALASALAEHLTVDKGIPVGLFSLEMSWEQLVDRMMCAHAGVNSSRLRRRMLNSKDFSSLKGASDLLSKAPMFVDDTAGLSLLTLRARARRLVRKHGIKALFVDYLQLMTCPGSENRQQEVSAISRGLKALAKELNIPVIALSQLNRGPEGRADKRPMLSDLRESGAIEQDADTVMMLHREDYYNLNTANYTVNNKAEVIVCKQRNGPTGTINLYFNSETTRFGSYAGVDMYALAGRKESA